MTTNLQQLQADPARFRRALIIPTPQGPRRLGEVMTDFQDRDFRALDPALLRLAGRGSGGYRRYWIERTKSSSKDSDAAISVLWLLAFSTRELSLQIAAVDRDQAALIKAAADSLLRLNPWLQPLITSQTSALLNSHTGSRCEILPADVAGAHGARPHGVWINELAHFIKADFANVLAANAAKNPEGLIAVLTNAGHLEHFAHEWRRTAEESPRWYFSSRQEPPPWVSQEDLEEQRQLLPEPMYRRLWQGEWTSGGGDALQIDEIRRAITLRGERLKPKRGWQFYGGLDLSTRHDHSALCLLAQHVGYAEEEEVPRRLTTQQQILIESGVMEEPAPEIEYRSSAGTGKIRLAHVRTWEAPIDLQQVERHILQVNAAVPFVLAADAWQAELMCQRLAGQMGVETVQFTGGNLQAMATALLDSFREELIELYDHAELIADLKQLQVQERSYGFRLVSPRTLEGGGTRHGDCATAFALALLLARRGVQRPHVVDRPLICWS